jgi:hypothetical protein
MRKSKGDVPVAYIIAIILGVLVMGLLGYWLYTSGPRVETFMTESECKTRKMSACTEWTGKGRPDNMPFRVWVDNNTVLPSSCTDVCLEENPTICGPDFRNKVPGFGGFAKAKYDLSVRNGNWWKCIAPGCEEKYGITIRSEADC